MKPDWKDAPEGATRLMRSATGSGAYAWADDGLVALRPGKRIPFIMSRQLWAEVERRPVAAWDGQGLPPVGTVCEAWFDDGRVCWHEAEVIYHMSDDPRLAAVRLRGDHHDKLAWADTFRPIRTAEQIAAEERELAIKEMRNSLEFPGGVNVHYVCATLYDLGYRKQVAP